MDTMIVICVRSLIAARVEPLRGITGPRELKGARFLFRLGEEAGSFFYGKTWKKVW